MSRDDTCKAAERASGTAAELDRLAKVARELEALTQELYNRLEPALTQNLPAQIADTKEPEPSSQLVAAIRCEVARFENAREGLRNLIERIDL